MDDTGKAFNWMFNDDQLRKTPSLQLGISHSQELIFRQKQAMLMQAMGQKSGLTQLAINTSVVFMHRFYMFRPVKYYPRIHVAMGFIFAAGKVEESARKLEHLIRTTIEILRHNKNGEYLDKRDKLSYEMDCECREKFETLFQNNCNIESAAYLEMRRTVLECEAEIYAVIGFHLQIVHPHNFVIRMCGLLGGNPCVKSEDGTKLEKPTNIKEISQYAYNLATASSQLTLLCLKYKPELIATVCLNIAAKAHAVKFMCMKDSSLQWYQVYDDAMDIREIESVSEEFLVLIKSCQLLPSWMTSLARAPRSAPRMAGSSKNMPSTSQGHSSRSHPSTSGLPSTSQAKDTSKLAQSSSSSSHPDQQAAHTSSSVNDAIAPANGSHHRSGNGEGSSAAPDHPNKESSHSSRSQIVGNAKPNAPPASGASAGGSAPSVPRPPSQHHSQPPPHRLHSGSGHNGTDRSSSSIPPSASLPVQPGAAPGSRPVPSSLSRHSSSTLPHGTRPHSGSSSQPRPRYDPNRPDSAHRADAPDVRRSSSRTMPPPDDANRSGHARSADYPTLQRPSESAMPIPTSKAATSPIVKQPSPPLPQTPEMPPPASAGDAGDLFLMQQDNANTPLSDKLRGSALNPRLSLSSYRERVRSRPILPSANESMTDDSGLGITGPSSEDTLITANAHRDSPANDSSIAGLKPSASAPNLTSLNMAQDSPTNPRIKIKVKRDPGSGERHSVKYADTGLKIKIKPPRMDPLEGEPGPSSSRSLTPMEEGEVVDSPGSSSSGDRKVEGGLKMRLPVPRSGESSNYLRSGDQANGYSSEHRAHHHSHHHRSHHGHKSKKHSSKHSSSRHERSSKRSSTHDLEERPSKTSRLEASDVASRYETSTRGLQHQNSGFSINDAFSSTLPSNIFDEDDDVPPVTPDAMPPAHHQRFHLIMSQHRAQLMEQPPLPPLPSVNGPPPPPPPPPPTFPPPPPSL